MRTRERVRPQAAFDTLVERWRPDAGLVYFHLLPHGLVERGDVDA